MKGMKKEMYQCSKCHAWFNKDEFSLEDDMCDYCLFPEIEKGRPKDISRKYGDPKNVTKERELLDNLQYIPEKQHSEA